MRWSGFVTSLLLLLLAGCASERFARPGLDAAEAPADGYLAETVGLASNLEASRWSQDAQSGSDDFFLAKNDAPAADPGAEQPARERMLIYSGELRVEVSRAEDAGAAFLAKVEQWGGYLQTQSGTTWTVRVPAAHFDEAFEAVRAAGRVLSENRRANDVTEEFVDLGIRVDNARKSRQRLLDILEKAEKVEDILKIESELRRLTDEIERMEGRLKYLRDQVAMSTLRAQFQPKAEAPPVQRQRRFSRFHWINRVGANAVMEGF